MLERPKTVLALDRSAIETGRFINTGDKNRPGPCALTKHHSVKA